MVIINGMSFFQKSPKELLDFYGKSVKWSSLQVYKSIYDSEGKKTEQICQPWDVWLCKLEFQPHVLLTNRFLELFKKKNTNEHRPLLSCKSKNNMKLNIQAFYLNRSWHFTLSKKGNLSSSFKAKSFLGEKKCPAKPYNKVHK